MKRLLTTMVRASAEVFVEGEVHHRPTNLDQIASQVASMIMLSCGEAECIARLSADAHHLSAMTCSVMEGFQVQFRQAIRSFDLVKLMTDVGHAARVDACVAVATGFMAACSGLERSSCMLVF